MYSSRKAGEGKTFMVHRYANEHCRGRCIAVPINGNVDPKFIIDRLNTSSALLSDNSEVSMHMLIRSSLIDHLMRLVLAFVGCKGL